MSKSKFIQNRCVCIAIFGKENTHQLLIGWHVVIYFWGVLYGRAVLQIWTLTFRIAVHASRRLPSVNRRIVNYKRCIFHTLTLEKIVLKSSQHTLKWTAQPLSGGGISEMAHSRPTIASNFMIFLKICRSWKMLKTPDTLAATMSSSGNTPDFSVHLTWRFSKE